MRNDGITRTTSGRHGWQRLTPAYARELVESGIQTAGPDARVLDPYGGSGTTGLVASEHGIPSLSLDINPYLVWLMRAKLRTYTTEDVRLARMGLDYFSLSTVATVMAMSESRMVAEPAIAHIDRWWDTNTRLYLRALKWEIDQLFYGIEDLEPGPRTLWLIIFARLVESTLGATYKNQSLTAGKTAAIVRSPHELAATMRSLAELTFTEAALSGNYPDTDARVILSSATVMSIPYKDRHDKPYTHLITSPPYANRMSYLRELRPAMYWLGYLKEPRDASDLDTITTGGTWGAATSRLEGYDLANFLSYSGPYLDAVRKVAKANEKGGLLMAKYLARYADDITSHLSAFIHDTLLAPNARAEYIIGNSMYYGVVVPVERLFADTMLARGWENILIAPLRQRSSNRQLIEYRVSGRWAGY